MTDAYLGTAVEKALRAVLDRGGVIGGTSAGAAIMSRVMITGGQEKATVGTGFGFLARHRRRPARPQTQPRQPPARRPVRPPGLAGVAIDEATALVVRQDRWQVIGKSYVVVCRLPGNGTPARFDVLEDGDEGKLDAWLPGACRGNEAESRGRYPSLTLLCPGGRHVWGRDEGPIREELAYSSRTRRGALSVPAAGPASVRCCSRESRSGARLMSVGAQTPTPPYYAVIFTSRRTAEDDYGYGTMAGRMEELAGQRPGFLGIERPGADRVGITVSYWSSLEALRPWGRQSEH